MYEEENKVYLKKSKSAQEKLLIKLGIIALLGVFFLLPTFQIQKILDERSSIDKKLKAGYTHQWNDNHTVGNILLRIPILHTYEGLNSEGVNEKKSEKKFVDFFPYESSINVNSKVQVRKRANTKIPIHESKVKIKTRFSGMEENIFSMHNDDEILWNEAKILILVNHSISSKDLSLKINDKNALTVNDSIPYMGDYKVLSTQMTKEELQAEIELEYSLIGMNKINFNPIANTTKVSMKSDWMDPGFFGSSSPFNYTKKNKEFTANWNIDQDYKRDSFHVLDSHRTFNSFDTRKFGVNFVVPLKGYQIITRVVKYSFLFIILTFLTIWGVEILCKFEFHYINYILTGFSLVLFYLLLLSFSEKLGFSIAYLIASCATISSVSLYIYGVGANKKGSFIVFSQLSILYTSLYVLLHIKENTLIIGSVSVWIILIAFMYLTRKINWGRLGLKQA